ncbi:hypothetical protein LT493_22460 [Streptomyces tricolor]|nr:hypothetical protein [Streptomyces tricolor]
MEECVDIRLADGRSVGGRVCRQDKEADLALVEIAADHHVDLPIPAADMAQDGDRWRGPYRPAADEVHLSGRIDRTAPHLCAGGATIEALQLTADQQLGDYLRLLGRARRGRTARRRPAARGGGHPHRADPGPVRRLPCHQRPHRGHPSGRRCDASTTSTSRTSWTCCAPPERAPPPAARGPPRFSGTEALLRQLDDWAERRILDPAQLAELKFLAVQKLIDKGTRRRRRMTGAAPDVPWVWREALRHAEQARPDRITDRERAAVAARLLSQSEALLAHPDLGRAFARLVPRLDALGLRAASHALLEQVVSRLAWDARRLRDDLDSAQPPGRRAGRPRPPAGRLDRAGDRRGAGARQDTGLAAARTFANLAATRIRLGDHHGAAEAAAEALHRAPEDDGDTVDRLELRLLVTCVLAAAARMQDRHGDADRLVDDIELTVRRPSSRWSAGSIRPRCPRWWRWRPPSLSPPVPPTTGTAWSGPRTSWPSRRRRRRRPPVPCTPRRWRRW